MKQITSDIRGYDSSKARKCAIKRYIRLGFNYFVCFKDTQSEFALEIGKVSWVKDHPYIDW